MGSGFTNDFQTGDVVGEFEMEAPGVSTYFLHGTLPLPAEIYFDHTTASPFAVRDQDGVVVAAQIEIVSRYPKASDGADVVELIAEVARPAGVNSGDRLVYEVLWNPNTPVAHRIDSAVQAMLNTSDALILRTTDVFGHSYEADLLSDLQTNNVSDLRTMRDGTYARQVRTHENLTPVTPVAGSTGTLPHMMGVHSYITTWKDAGYITIDLRVHNGHQGLDSETDEDDSMGKVYFNEIELVVPDGWILRQAFETQTFGIKYNEGVTDVYPILEPVGGGDLHVMRIQDQFHRRLVLSKAGWNANALSAVREEGLAFCRDGISADDFRFLSWWNPVSARYATNNLPLPDLGFLETPSQSRTQVENEFSGVVSAFEAGTTGPWPMTYGAQGWAHPWGPKSGGYQGGSEINFWDGVRTAYGRSVDGYRLFQTIHRMYSERHPTALYDRYGDAYSMEDWIYAGPDGPVLPNWMLLIPWAALGDPHGFLLAPTFQVTAVANQDRTPAYEGTLAGFEHIDTEHLIRYTRNTKALVWLGNDSLAKDDLMLQAELCRATYTKLPQNNFGAGISTGLLRDWEYIQTNPGDGFDLNRGDGWVMDTVSAYYSVAEPAWRTKARPWFDDVIDLVEMGQSTCSGTIMSKPNTAHFGGQYRILQSISESILEFALWGMRSSVLDGDDAASAGRLNEVIKKSAYAMISPRVWSISNSAPHFYTALGPYDQGQPSFCGYVPPDGHESYDNWQTWNVFSYGYILTGDQQFLTKAGQMAGGTLTVENVLGNGNVGKVETRAGIIGVLQSLE
ncbi:MAG: hypothetical protein ACI8X5_000293 [Planctomycetota bacterium]|jgi:hypothetical protein